MARIRSGIAYRLQKRPYTRVSKFRAKSYVRTRPHLTIVKFDSGNANRVYEYRSDLISTRNINIRHNALESARQVCNRVLETTIGKQNYCMKVRPFPHHMIRENPLAGGAGADRMSTGMAHNYGKVISAAARVMADQIIISVLSDKASLNTVKIALKRANSKFPCTCKVVATESKNLKKN